jgi:hypothetical protein
VFTDEATLRQYRSAWMTRYRKRSSNQLTGGTRIRFEMLRRNHNRSEVVSLKPDSVPVGALQGSRYTSTAFQLEVGMSWSPTPMESQNRRIPTAIPLGTNAWNESSAFAATKIHRRFSGTFWMSCRPTLRAAHKRMTSLSWYRRRRSRMVFPVSIVPHFNHRTSARNGSDARRGCSNRWRA